MSEHAPNIAPLNDGSVAPPETTPDAPEPAPITEQEVGEYREQDRFLPVRAITLPLLTLPLPSLPPRLGLLLTHLPEDCKCGKDYEIQRPCNSQNLKGSQGMCPGMRLGVHKLHHKRSRREMPRRETQNHRRRGYPLRHGHSRVRPICRDSQDPPRKTETGTLATTFAPHTKYLNLYQNTAGAKPTEAIIQANNP